MPNETPILPTLDRARSPVDRRRDGGLYQRHSGGNRASEDPQAAGLDSGRDGEDRWRDTEHRREARAGRALHFGAVRAVSTDDRKQEEGAGRITKPRAYLYAEDLAELTPWTVEAIDKMVARGTLRRGIHWFQPAGRRIFKWAAIIELIEGGEGRDSHLNTPALARTNAPVGRKILRNVEEATERLRRVLDRGA
jgi:hypothetical protein